MRRSRLLLSLLLLVLAGAAQAGPQRMAADEPIAAPQPSSGDTGTPREPDDDPAKRDARGGKTAPVRGNGQRPAAPRWHSFLPGMIR